MQPILSDTLKRGSYCVMDWTSLTKLTIMILIHTLNSPTVRLALKTLIQLQKNSNSKTPLQYIRKIIFQRLECQCLT